MKWPNIAKVDNVLKERDPDAKALEDRSSDAMSYFTGMILPGGTTPWLIMNTLVDCDDDVGPNSLAALTHVSSDLFLSAIAILRSEQVVLEPSQFILLSLRFSAALLYPECFQFLQTRM